MIDEAPLRTALARDGYTEILTREFAADAHLPEHSHVWDARVHVLRGEMQLSREGGTQHLLQGDHCEVPREQLHAERYGPQGTLLLIGRRYLTGTRTQTPAQSPAQ
jgi:quercetin dioxygenase-like cupin family protein